MQQFLLRFRWKSVWPVGLFKTAGPMRRKKGCWRAKVLFRLAFIWVVKAHNGPDGQKITCLHLVKI
ncbi:MAG TPA: hypothetical protein DHE23_10645 [Agrobacterium sp.]|nr:hypothetical protein [Agrobacterium sp.]